MRIALLGDSLTTSLPGSSYVAFLRERLPGHMLVNLGKANDTVVSLYRRLKSLPFEPFDVVFLWVGVNDLPAQDSRLYRGINALMGQRRARDLDEFRAYYQRTLDLVCGHAGRVIAVSPLLRGEDIGNEWNCQIQILAGSVEELTTGYEKVEFLDLRPAFARALAAKPISGYTPQSAIRVILDALTLQSDEQVDRMAARRGLHLTLDGLHLNSVGARIVADSFLEVLQDIKDDKVLSQSSCTGEQFVVK